MARDYLRVSKDRDGRGTSPDQQHEENTRAVTDRGWALHPDPYRDDGISASRYAKRARTGFDALIGDLEHDRFGAQVLVLWESSRGSRRVSEWVTLIELCELRGVRILVTTHGRDYDPANPRDRRSLLEDAVDSEYESAKTSQRIRRNVRAAAEQGRPHGKHLYGYRRIYDDRTRSLLHIEPDPETAPIVQEAAQRFLAGESCYAIAKRFNERQIPPRRTAYRPHRLGLGWTMAAIGQMLRMPAYAGKREHNGTIIGDALWPALIDPVIWETQLVPRLNDASRTKTNDWPARHLLSGIAVCGICRCVVRVGKQNLGRATHDDHGNRVPPPHYSTYLCAGAPGKSSFHVTMKKEHLDAVVTEWALARIQRPDFLAVMGQRGGDADAERLALLDEIEGHRAYLDSVREQAAARQRLDLLLDQEDRVQPLIDAAQRKLEQLVPTDPVLLDLAKAPDVELAWTDLELPLKRRVIRALMVPQIMPVGKTGQKGINYERVDPGWR